MIQATYLGPALSPGLDLLSAVHSDPSSSSSRQPQPVFSLSSGSSTSFASSHASQVPNRTLTSARTSHPSYNDDYDDHVRNGNENVNGNGEEELAWQSRRLVWSHNGEIFRQFSYDHEGEGEDVAFALFAGFQLGDMTSTSPGEAGSSVSGRSRGYTQAQGQAQSTKHGSAAAAGMAGKQKGKDMGSGEDGTSNNSNSDNNDSTFGPFHDSHLASWGGPRPLPNTGLSGSGSGSSSSSSSRWMDARWGRGIQRCLMVFLQRKAYIYFPSGEEVVVHLPFVVERAWSLPSPSTESTTTARTGYHRNSDADVGNGRGGVMIQRRLERRELRRMQSRSRSVLRGMDLDPHGRGNSDGYASTSMSALDDLLDMEEEGDGLPRLWTLERPFEELSMVVEAEGSRLLSAIPASSTVLFAAEEPYPILVAYDNHTRQVMFYRRRRVALEVDSEMEIPKPALTTRTMRPSDILHPPDPPPLPSTITARGRPSLHRHGSSFAPGPAAAAERRVSGRADPLDRTTRRAPRLSRGAAAAPEPTGTSATGELHATLDPPPLGVAIAAPSKSKIARPRASSGIGIGAEGFPSDNRRTSGASAFLRQETNDRWAVHGAGERDLRETTMMMGLDKEEKAVRSEIVLERVGSWRPPSDFNPESAKVYISEDLTPAKACLNIHASSHLYIFDVFLNTQVRIEPIRSIPCLAAVPIISTRHAVLDTLLLLPDNSFELLTSSGRHIALTLPKQPPDGRDEVARRMASSLSMIIDEDERMTAYSDRRIIDIVDPVNSSFTVIYEDGEKMRFSADLRVRDRLVRQCLESLSMALPAQSFFTLKRELLAQLGKLPTAQKEDSRVVWRTFATVMRGLLGLQVQQPSRTAFENLLRDAQTSPDPITRRLAIMSRRQHPSKQHIALPKLMCGETLHATDAAPALLALHLVGQDCRLSLARQAKLDLLAPLLLDIAGGLGRLDWWDYWKRLVPTASCLPFQNRNDVDTSLLSRIETPPDIIACLSRRITTPLKPFPTSSSFSDSTSEYGLPEPCHLTTTLCEIYNRLGAARGEDRASHHARAADTVTFMVSRGLTTEWLTGLSFGVAMPIIEMIRHCQANPSRGWEAEGYDFIGRADWAIQATGLEAVAPGHAAEVQEDRPTVGDIMAQVTADNTAKSASSALPHVRFGSDRRVQEVERIMQTSKVRTVSAEDPKGASDQEIIQYHQNVVNTLANRTLAVTVGQGIFNFGTRSTTITDAWEIPLIELSVKVLPGNSVIKAQIAAEHGDWPCFHNGVSAALSIAPDCKGIDSSWIVFNRPQTLNPEHGGFLLGLGLTGHLRSLVTYHAFPYMEPRHDYTSCGLLLGLACSFAGSEDLLITKVLSLHTHALLPLGSMELNASPVVQCSALLGLGLVYAGTRSLRMAEIALTEVGRRELVGVDSFSESQESYSFSASMAFALIMLGRGGKSEVDRRLLSQIRRYIYGDATLGKSSGPDTTLTAPGATLALGLMYLKTGRRDIADMLEIPQTAFAVEIVRPDVLLLRTLARSLIMWDDIHPSLSWIESHLPPFIQSAHQGHKKTSTMELATELAYFNIIAGSCFAIGLKTAGTASELAHNNLMFFYGVLNKAASGQSMTYEGKIRRNAARQCLNIVTLSLAMVMSGTGELNVLRRLRVSHGQEGAGVTYGTHMAMHMACGLLFLGRGHYTLGNSHIAIAALCIAFFPRFQPLPGDNKAYPQAFRHLWALAVEPRCLQAKDVDSRETVYLPVKLATKSKERTQNLISPTLIAPFETISSIDIDSPRYWPLSYDLANPSHRSILVNSQTVFVKRKSAFLDYNSDPKGNRSIFVRAGFMSGFELYYDLISPAAPATITPGEVLDLVKAHSGDPALIAMASVFSSAPAATTANAIDKDNSSMVDAFIRHILIECISNDKPQMISVYLSMLLSLLGPLRIDTMVQLAMLRRFYSPGVFDKYFVSPQSDKRSGWLRSSFLSAASRKIEEGNVDVDAELVRRYFTQGQWPDRNSDSKRESVPDATSEQAQLRLGVYLKRNNVPPIRLLSALQDAVRRNAGEKEVLVLEHRVREAARGYDYAAKRQYDDDDHEGTGDSVNRSGDAGLGMGIWKSESVKDVVAAWVGEA